MFIFIAIVCNMFWRNEYNVYYLIEQPDIIEEPPHKDVGHILTLLMVPQLSC